MHTIILALSPGYPGGREGGREGEREGGREGGREREREGERERGREGGREGGEGWDDHNAAHLKFTFSFHTLPLSLPHTHTLPHFSYNH